MVNKYQSNIDHTKEQGLVYSGSTSTGLLVQVILPILMKIGESFAPVMIDLHKMAL